MSIVRSVSGAVAAVALALVPVVVSASDKGASTDNVSTPSAQATQFTALKSVKAVPMSSSDLKAVKGLHFHFTTPADKLLLVNVQKGHDGFDPTPNPDSSSTAPFIVGKGYRGLCGAALNSPALSIPGQNTTTGIGGGCGE